MATLKDVAFDAGVSIATVSCCLSGNRNVKPETKMKVMDSIEKLKYIPNSSARSLKKSISNTVGIVLPDIDDTYYTEIFKGISSFLQKKGYSVNVAFSDNAVFNEYKIIEEFISQNVSGLLIITAMPQNTSFFQHRIKDYEIPCVFIEHKPQDTDVNFIGFDNRRTVYHLTEQLLKKHYRRIALITGPKYFSSETDSIEGYKEAFLKYNLPFDSSLIQETNMSKEDCFKTVLTNLDLDTLEAVITTSESIALGALEAFHVQNISVPENIQLLTLSEEGWNKSSRIPGVIYTSRTAFTLGYEAANMLLTDIKKQPQNKKSLFLDDRILFDSLSIPEPSKKFPFILTKDNPVKPLRILMVDLPSSRAAKILSKNFTKSTNIPLEINLLPHDQLLECIENDAKQVNHKYDIYMYDVPWLSFMVQNNLVSDISEYVNSTSFPKETIFLYNLESCKYKDRYFGVPFISGSQLLYYRKDLFENHQIAKKYKEKYHLSLRPPKTWTEFNHTAEFFTRSLNPDSPTLYGTSVAGVIDEELAPEILIRLWSCSGNLWDEYKRATLNTTHAKKAFQSLLQTVSYCEHIPTETSIAQTVSDFSSGKTAMLLTYSEYAGQISKGMYQNIIGQVGYALLPGKTSVNVGWALGMNPYTMRQQEVFLYFDWLFQKQTSYYMTIMGGQPPVISPYHSHEIIKLYPWLEYTEPNFSYCRKRIGPVSDNALIIPQNRIERVLCCAFKDILKRRLSLEDALSKWQLELEYIFKAYGYPKPLHFLEESAEHINF